MTREEQRIEEAKNRFSDDQIYPISKMFVFVQGAKWADETMIDKACEWLYNNWKGEDFYMTDIIEGLRKAMEE